ncbi:efflux RND transporter permease subunit [Methanococcus voltae]|uniref:Hydrophobe/amphiphile efflux-3 (HAE3) family protein n=2 Tax=Methanococcus voltae TaxID=2188 RepID=A0A8J7UV36_METVO|nr:MMPL family transporter [Methanococcus voltae]MBP2172953.1 hydrophobe/amphiphile efflux-3 (HAE3) family protein [Methanococcus voltae]MBP2201991.1 hydrophobe/amphiphile efflux-3 (HAE3) family protein [Methanococcus voltae]MCS3922154.1 hydrophobe/amphiphile efflux-3 (HAE3) family protein [Methanococcus voltae PS]
MIKKVLGKIAHISEKRPFMVVAIVMLITIFMSIMAGNVKTETGYESMLPDDNPVIQALDDVRDKFGGSSVINVAVKLAPSDNSNRVNDIRDPEVLHAVDYIIKDIETMDSITRVSATSDIIIQQNGGIIPNDIQTVKNIFRELPEDAKPKVFGNDYTMILISANTNADSGRQKELAKDLMDRVEEAPLPPGTVAVVTGSPAISETMDRLMDEGMMITSLFAMVIIFLILLLYFKSPIKSTLPLIPVIIAVIWSQGSMGILNIPRDMASSLVSSLLLGLGIDYGIHLYHRYKEEMKLGNSLEKSIETAVVSTGSAVLVTTATTVAGFAALTIAPLPMMANMGITCALGIAFSMIVVIILLPALIVIDEKHTPKLLNGLKFLKNKFLKED